MNMTHWMVYLLFICWSTVLWHILFTQRPFLTLVFSLGISHSRSLEKMYNDMYQWLSFTQSVFTVRKILCALPSSSSTPISSSSTMLSIVWPFTECHVVGITQYVVFSDWVPSFSNIHLGFFHIFAWLDGSFFLVSDNAEWCIIYRRTPK